MKSKKTKKTKKTSKPKKLLHTNPYYIYWYACANPAFGKRLLQKGTGALKAGGFELTPGQIMFLDKLLGKDQQYVVSGAGLLDLFCNMKSTKPPTKPEYEPTPPIPATTPLPVEGGKAQIEPQTISKPIPPPPWG